MRFSHPTYRRSCLADGGRKRPGKAFLLLSGLLALSLCLGGLPSGAQAQGIPGLFSGKGSTKTETGTGAPAAETTADGNAQPEAAGSEVAPADGAGEGANLLQTVDEFTEDAVEARDVLKSIVQKIPEIQDVMVETLRAQGGRTGSQLDVVDAGGHSDSRCSRPCGLFPGEPVGPAAIRVLVPAGRDDTG